MPYCLVKLFEINTFFFIFQKISFSEAKLDGEGKSGPLPISPIIYIYQNERYMDIYVGMRYIHIKNIFEILSFFLCFKS